MFFFNVFLSEHALAWDYPARRLPGRLRGAPSCSVPPLQSTESQTIVKSIEFRPHPSYRRFHKEFRFFTVLFIIPYLYTV